MENNEFRNKYILNTILIILVIVGGFIFTLLVFTLISGESNTNTWRKTSEGLCFKRIAISFCENNNMEFKKLYVWAYDSDFSCYENLRGNNFKDFDFTREEKLKCGDYYGKN